MISNALASHELRSLTSQYRARRGRKKNDIIDAGNVARALLANPQLSELNRVEQQRTLQELTRTQRRLSEQLKATRSAQQEWLRSRTCGKFCNG